jgi:DNA-binding cell septation regulator SpoVG
MNNPTPPPEFTISNWRPHQSGSLRGFFSTTIQSTKLIIHDCQLLEKSGRRWINLPSRPYESQGERKYAPIIEFQTRDTADHFQTAVLAALSEYIASTGGAA